MWSVLVVGWLWKQYQLTHFVNCFSLAENWVQYFFCGYLNCMHLGGRHNKFSEAIFSTMPWFFSQSQLKGLWTPHMVSEVEFQPICAAPPAHHSHLINPFHNLSCLEMETNSESCGCPCSAWQSCSRKAELQPEGVSQSEWFKLHMLHKSCLCVDSLTRGWGETMMVTICVCVCVCAFSRSEACKTFSHS